MCRKSVIASTRPELPVQAVWFNSLFPHAAVGFMFGPVGCCAIAVGNRLNQFGVTIVQTSAGVGSAAGP